MAGTWECSNGPSGSIECGGISLLAENGLASEEGFYSLFLGVSK